MVSHLVFYQLGLIVLVWVFLILSGLWPSAPAAARPMPPQPLMPRCKHSKKGFQALSADNGTCAIIVCLLLEVLGEAFIGEIPGW